MVRKYSLRFFLDFEKEEAWYNKMAQKGWMLDGYFFIVYRFAKGEPGEYIYREELLPNFIDSSESHAYLDFIKTADVEVVVKWGSWVICRRKASNGIFELYTDTDSRIALYQRVSRLFLLSCVVELAAVLMVILSLYMDPSWPKLFPLAIVSLAGLALFLVGWRFRKKHHRLVKEQQLLE